MIWKLKKGGDRRIRAGHPWVFASELAQAPKGVVSGSPVDLQDDQGRFVARGYANPASMITFRALTFDPQEFDVLTRAGLLRRTLEAWESRRRLGFRGSFRMVFAEGDRLPGLIIDYYRGEAAGRPVQVFALQVSTAGMNKAFGEAETFFRELVAQAIEKKLSVIPWEDSAVVLRNDIRARDQEGLSEEPPRFVKSVREADFTNFKILLNAATDDGFVEMNCDLFQGQKTGFFLDQTANIQTVCHLLTQDPDLPKDRPLRVLDLCCYVGHWSSQVTRTLKKLGHEVEVSLVDVSVKALEFARKNAERQGAVVRVIEADVLKSLSNIEPAYDIVIADPPAFIKSKKDIPIGKHAYMKVNTHAFRLATAKGMVVSCSCSGLLDEENFKEVISKALRRNFLDARCVARGGPAPDHPGRLSFPEGMYLKMYVHQLSGQTAGAGAGAIADGDVPFDGADVADEA